MRKIQKKRAEEISRLMEQAHMEIKTALESGEIDVASDLLIQCQETAIELGTYIETLEGEGFVTIPLIENYCEKLYQFYEMLRQGNDSVNIKNVNKSLNKAWIQVENSIRSDIKIRKEIVFLPYKVSMWDAMESIWKSAVADPDCDVYVIPIPYYDRDPSGEIHNMQYEGNDYPDYVTITNYETFDFEEHHPDVVFIHNTFDKWNLVTSVHPFFYTENIKQYTDCLVYVPYFITGGQQAEGHCMLPAYFVVDYIIAQSRQHKQQFDKCISDKVLALGSPKFDKVINPQIGDKGIPEEWKKKISDFVFFYNTSISGLLKNPSLAIEKMKYVFEIFEKTEAVIIWRSHPLFESTIHAMCPEVLESYKEAVAFFKNLKNGILDTTADASIAIQTSDAYIGEETSSIVHLFGVLGKPILLTNMSIHEDFTEDTGYVTFFDITDDGTALWMPVGDCNSLLRYEKSSGTVKQYEIPGEKKEGQRLYNAIIPYGEFLYLIPYRAKEIAVFNKTTEQFTKIGFPEPGNTNFSKAYVYNKKLYLIPLKYSNILELDCETNAVIAIDGGYLKRMFPEVDAPFGLNGSMMIGQNLLIALSFKDEILQIDLSNMDKKIIRLNTNISEGEEQGFWCMAGDTERIILGSNTGKRLLYWNRSTNECKTLEAYPEDWMGDDRCFFEMVYLAGCVYVFPKYGNKVLKIDLESLQIESMIDGNDSIWNHMEARKNDYYKWPSNTLFAKNIEDHILLQRAYDLNICEISEEEEIRNIQIDLSDVLRETDMQSWFYRRGKNLPWAIRETRRATIPNFIKYVESGIHDKAGQIREYSVIADNLDGTAGEKIYRRVSEDGVGR